MGGDATVVTRRTPLNERQAELLERVAGGDTLSAAEDAVHRASVYALSNRGLVSVTKLGGVFAARITDRGQRLVDGGGDPGGGASAVVAAVSPGQTVPARKPTTRARAKAKSPERDLISRLMAADDKTVTITSPDEAERAEYRRAIHAVKQHNLVPEGYLLRHTGRNGGDLVIRLLDAQKPDETDWNRVRLNLRKPVPAVADFGMLLDENPAAIEVSEAQRPRARAFLLELAETAARKGHGLKLARRGRYAKLGYTVGAGRGWTARITEEYDEEPQTPPRGRTRAWQSWDYRPMKKVASGRLRLIVETTMGYPDKYDVWADGKNSTLEKQIPRIIRRLQDLHDDNARAHQQWLREQAERQAAEAIRREADKLEWEAAMERARPQAVNALRHSTLIAALQAWRDARDMREICTALETSAQAARVAGQHDLAGNLESWRTAGLALADTVDPTTGGDGIGHIDCALEPTPDDLRPFLNGLNPQGPGHSIYYSLQRPGKPSRPWPEAWEQFR